MSLGLASDERHRACQLRRGSTIEINSARPGYFASAAERHERGEMGRDKQKEKVISHFFLDLGPVQTPITHRWEGGWESESLTKHMRLPASKYSSTQQQRRCLNFSYVPLSPRQRASSN